MRVELSVTPISIATQVSPNCNIKELTSNIGIHVHYRLKINDNTNPDVAPAEQFHNYDAKCIPNPVAFANLFTIGKSKSQANTTL